MTQSTNTRTRHTRPALFLAAAAATLVTAFGAGPASAATQTGSTQTGSTQAGPAAPSATDVASATAAANGSLGTVAQFFAAGGQRPTGTSQAQAMAARAAAPHLDSATVPVYYLNRAFVAGSDAAAPVATLAFLATDAVSSSGAHASVWTARTPDGWQVVNIASGSDETAYAAQAGPGGTAFKEPQIGAWYTERGGRVLPLNDAAKRSVGAGGMTVQQYRALVQSRYGAMLPGSAYDKNGLAGGFDPDTKAGAAPATHAHAAAQHVVPKTGGSPLLPLTGLGLAALASVGLGYAAYRKVSRTG